MCGITGILRPTGTAGPDLGRACADMTTRLKHRGPDDSGLWLDEAAGVALGHRRLSILDLSPLGRQPMTSASSRYVLCFNGEVYNHLELRDELKPLGHVFRGGSDTETMLAAFEAWGLEQALERFIGMFALALWDTHERTLFLVRDRLGVKPLVYGRAGADLVFGSELGALRCHPGFDPEINRNVVAQYLRHGYIPAPGCIHRHAHKLPPGSMLVAAPAREPQVRVWWNAAQIWREGATNPFAGSEDEAVDELERLLSDAVRLRLISDVPLGALLSGGVDSSLVTALMQSHSDRPVQTFSIGFAEAAFDESVHARTVAAHLGCEHTELTLSPADLLDMVPEVPRIWDEPFADPSEIPTLLVSRLARQRVTVTLSGDGGDELFSGYSRYFALAGAGPSGYAAPLRRALGGLAAPLAAILPGDRTPLLGDLGWKLRWRLASLGFRNFADSYRYFTSVERHPLDLVINAREPDPRLDATETRGLDSFQAMGLMDIAQYLPDDVLTKVDRASMAVALEVRTPLLDHRLAVFAASLPTAFKVDRGQGKRLLLRVLHRYVPPALVDRPKQGFGVPIAEWLRGPLRPWAEFLLAPARLKARGIVNPAKAGGLWRAHLAGRPGLEYRLWNLLMLEAWLDGQAKKGGRL